MVSQTSACFVLRGFAGRLCYLRLRMYREPDPPPPEEEDKEKHGKILGYLLASVLMPLALFGCVLWFVVGMCGR